MDFFVSLLIALPICVLIVGGTFFILGKAGKKHVVFEFKDHIIEVFTSSTGARFVVDGIEEDGGKRYGYDFHFDFIKKIGNDVIRVYITRQQGVIPEIKLYVNDEKQDIEY